MQYLYIFLNDRQLVLIYKVLLQKNRIIHVEDKDTTLWKASKCLRSFVRRCSVFFIKVTKKKVPKNKIFVLFS